MDWAYVGLLEPSLISLQRCSWPMACIRIILVSLNLSQLGCTNGKLRVRLYRGRDHIVHVNWVMGGEAFSFINHLVDHVHFSYQ